MSRIHNGFDVYVGQDLTHSMALVVEDNAHHTLSIRTRDGGTWSEQVKFTDTSVIASNRDTWSWDGTGPDGVVRVTIVRRKGAGCKSCGGKA